MDETPGSKKAPPADDLVPSAAQQAAEQQSSSSPEPDAGVTGMKASGGGEDDDEQVERFYALLDNIRAMRGMVSTGGTGTAAGSGRKRARETEPPWRPAFRMEDFELEEVDSARCAGEKKKRESSAKRPADEEQQQEEGEVVVVEAKGPAGVLAVDS